MKRNGERNAIENRTDRTYLDVKLNQKYLQKTRKFIFKTRGTMQNMEQKNLFK